jgi:hypothetical protein
MTTALPENSPNDLLASPDNVDALADLATPSSATWVWLALRPTSALELLAPPETPDASATPTSLAEPDWPAEWKTFASLTLPTEEVSDSLALPTTVATLETAQLEFALPDLEKEPPELLADPLDKPATTDSSAKPIWEFASLPTCATLEPPDATATTDCAPKAKPASPTECAVSLSALLEKSDAHASPETNAPRLESSADLLELTELTRPASEKPSAPPSKPNDADRTAETTTFSSAHHAHTKPLNALSLLKARPPPLQLPDFLSWLFSLCSPCCFNHRLMF